MKKIFRKLKTNLKNSGSTLILVIIALGFVGILTGSLLTAVAYAYRQKLYDYNAKSNFYYLEQAMDEVYAGLGSKTMNYMTEAYEETREEAIVYNVRTHEYESMENSSANALFKDKFMDKFYKAISDTTLDDSFVPKDATGNVSNSAGSIATTAGLGKTIVDCISNYKDSTTDTKGTVELVTDDMVVVYVYKKGDGTVVQTGIPGPGNGIFYKLIIKNVTLKRISNYNRSNARGDFEQTISTDIEISRPDFDVSFDESNSNINNLFEFCVLSDSGVEVNKKPGSVLSFNGNIYASNDFYDKPYNNYDNSNDAAYQSELVWNKIDGHDKKYKMNKVTDLEYVDNSTTTLYNHNELANGVTSDKAKYDGNNIKSKYSGFYVDSGAVNVFANKVIVPGSIAVMNAGTLSIYGTDGTSVTQSNVWADEVVLDGSYRGAVKSTKEVGGHTEITELYDTDIKTNFIASKTGAKADFTANMYIKDDTQIESDYSRFRLNGSYYGFGNSTAVDTRKFIPTTLISTSPNGGNIYEEYGNLGAGKGDGNKIRAHYNSSAFIVNGEHANVNLLDTKEIFIAGRSYIELSKIKTAKDSVSYKYVTDENGNQKTMVISSNGTETNKSAASAITTTTMEYDADLKDYKTGESLSIKSNQLAYKPNAAPAKEKYVKDSSGVFEKTVTEQEANSLGSQVYEMYFSYLPEDLKDMYLFKKYFSTAAVDEHNVGKVPVVYAEEQYTRAGSTTTETKYYYYLDFEFAYDNNMFDTNVFTKDSNVSGKIYIDSADDLTKYFITDYYNYLAYVDEYKQYGAVAFVAAHSGIDTNVLENENEVTVSGTTFYRKDTLVDLMDYENYNAGAIGTKADNIYASGAVTTSYKKTPGEDPITPMTSQAGLGELKNALTSDDNVVFFVQTKSDAEIHSTVLGADENTVSSTTVTNETTSLDLSEEYEEHYNYMKWALRDLPEDNSTIAGKRTESEFIRYLVTQKGSNSLTPLNSYFNFDTIKRTDPDMGGTATLIDPTSLPLSYNSVDHYSEYKVYVSNDDVHISCQSAAENGKITGIIVTKGDVYFDEYSGSDSYKTVKEFNGIIVTGGKVFINNTITNINASDLCKNIMNQCIVKSQDCTSTDTVKKRQALMAIKVLELFKDYEEYGAKQRYFYEHPDEASDDAGDSYKTITTIDYSDVLRYNNWMRNVD